MPTANIGHEGSGLEPRNDTVERREPGVDQVGDVAGSEEALAPVVDVAVVLVPAQAVSGACGLDDAVRVAGGAERDLHYPSIKPELVGLTSALHGLAHDASARAQFLADANTFATRFPLTPEQSRALVLLDVPAIVAMGTHPLVAFLANMQVQRDRAGRG